MPIVGFNFTKLNAEKKNLITKDTKININSKLGIKEVHEEKLPTGKTKADGLRFDFEFILEYQPKIANITIEGNIYYTDDPKTMQDIIKTWKDKKDIPVKIKQLVLNTVVLKASIKALSLEQEINIPPHMPFPIVRPANEVKGREYIG
ncbi:MAG: hypothetical protein AABW46_01155 [Nanoarchaeota archaeon]